MAYTKNNTRVEDWHSHVFYDAAGVVTRVDCRVDMVSRLVNDADAIDVVRRTPDPVSFDLLGDAADVSVTAAGKTVTGAQLGALMRAMALNRANARGIT